MSEAHAQADPSTTEPPGELVNIMSVFRLIGHDRIRLPAGSKMGDIDRVEQRYHNLIVTFRDGRQIPYDLEEPQLIGDNVNWASPQPSFDLPEVDEYEDGYLDGQEQRHEASWCPETFEAIAMPADEEPDAQETDTKAEEDEACPHCEMTSLYREPDDDVTDEVIVVRCDNCGAQWYEHPAEDAEPDEIVSPSAGPPT